MGFQFPFYWIALPLNYYYFFKSIKPPYDLSLMYLTDNFPTSAPGLLLTCPSVQTGKAQAEVLGGTVLLLHLTAD